MDLFENRWQQTDGEVAARVAVKDVRGWLCKQLIVEPGQRVLLSADGHPYPIQGPGRYAMADIGDRLAKLIGARAVQRMNAVLFADGVFSLSFAADGFFTQDPYQVGLEVIVTLQINQPETVNMTLLRGKTTVREDEIADYLMPDVTNAAQEWIGTHSLNELVLTFTTKDDFEIHLTQRVARVCEAIGLTFKQLRTLNYRLIHRDRLNEINESYLIKETALAAELAGETKLFDLLTEKELLDIRKETRDVEMFERRAVVRERMRKAVRSDRFDEMRDERETEQFLRSIDQERLLTDDEWERIQRTIAWRTDDELRTRDEKLEDRLWRRHKVVDDRQRDRVYLLARLEMERQFALKSAELTHRQAHDPALLQHEIEMARMQLEAQQMQEVLEQGHTIAKETQRAAFEAMQERQQRTLQREQQKLDDIEARQKELQTAKLRRTISLADAKTQAEIDKLRREAEQAEAEFGFLNLERMKQIRLLDDEKRQAMRLGAEDRRFKIELEREDRLHQRALERVQQDQQHELARIDKLRGMSPQALVVVAGDLERAQIIRDMAETQAMQGMTEEQILAKMSGNSPDAARALAEIRVAAASGQMETERREMYERLLQQQGRVTDTWRDQTERLERMRRDDTLDRQAERDSTRGLIESQLSGMAAIERAKAQQQQPPPNVIVTGGGGQSSESGYYRSAEPHFAPRERETFLAVDCPKCGAENRPNAKFCGECAQPLT